MITLDPSTSDSPKGSKYILNRVIEGKIVERVACFTEEEADQIGYYWNTLPGGVTISYCIPCKNEGNC